MDTIRSKDIKYINRELSWLEFNARVLELAGDKKQPLLERAKFLAIFSQNLDEFFQVRVAALKDQLEAGISVTSTDTLSPGQQLKAIRNRVEQLLEQHSNLFTKDVLIGLKQAGIKILNWDELNQDTQDEANDIFNEGIFPVLTPLAVDPGHPFPYISNLSLSIAAIVGDPCLNQHRFVRVKVPSLLPRFVQLKDSLFVPLEQVITAHLDSLFPGMQIQSPFTFRITRNADLTLEEDAEDLLSAVEIELRRRRFGQAVRLEIPSGVDPEVRSLLMKELEVENSDVYEIDSMLDLSSLWSLYDLARPDLKAEPWIGITQPGLADAEDEMANIFSLLKERDILVQHPYDSFASSVEAFISQAARDPHVLAIKQTLYRTSGDSPIVKSLIRAADSGKQVVALVELKARFDEQANIAWARALEQAGVHVVYGLMGLKTHSKTALVVRQERGVIKRYCHIGTGNYNSKTAKIYEDIGLLSSDEDLGSDLSQLFNFITGFGKDIQYKRLIVAPQALRSRMIELIETQASKKEQGLIVMKLNNLSDPLTIEALYKASMAGAKVQLIVRSICRLRPGVQGLSENITVRSIVDRYLEHSRIFAFGGPDEPCEFFIGSADLMERNLDRRVEVITPVLDKTLQRRIWKILTLCLADDTHAWKLNSDASWERIATTKGINSQSELRSLALKTEQHRKVLDPGKFLLEGADNL